MEQRNQTRRWRRATLIYNPRAGRKQQRRAGQISEAKRFLEQAGVEIRVAKITPDHGGAALASEAVAQGAELVIVCGGDGTINHCLGNQRRDGLAGTGVAGNEVPLAILPGGTANILARELGLPLDIVEAAKRIPRCRPRRIALGRANGRYFISVAGAGFDARVIAAVEADEKKMLGMGSYVMTTLRELLSKERGPRVRYRVEATDGEGVTGGGEAAEGTAELVIVERAGNYWTLREFPEADLFDDRFHVYCFERASVVYFLRYGWTLVAGGRRGHPVFRMMAARRLELATAAGETGVARYQVDGEVAGELTDDALCRMEIVPDALTLLAPVRE